MTSTRMPDPKTTDLPSNSSESLHSCSGLHEWYRVGWEQGQAAERDRIVAWIRSTKFPFAAARNYISDAIERGEHDD